jgi:hypothetical protein
MIGLLSARVTAHATVSLGKIADGFTPVSAIGVFNTQEGKMSTPNAWLTFDRITPGPAVRLTGESRTN